MRSSARQFASNRGLPIVTPISPSSRRLARALPGGAPHRHAFTLVEMLLVVAVIALLIAILLPSMSSAREYARRAKCLANQHLISAGVAAYASANAGHLPLFKTWATHFISSSPESYVDARPLLHSLTATPDAYYCPSHAVLNVDSPDVGWNGSAPDRFMSYGPIGIWYQHSVSIQFPKTYITRPAFAKPTLDHQGNRPTRLASASPDMAVTTDSQIAWYAGSWGLSFTYPGDGQWPESPAYYSYYSFPHRERNNAWAGSNAVFFDGSGRWGNTQDILNKNLPYPHGAKWIMHYKRGVYEGPVFW